MNRRGFASLTFGILFFLGLSAGAGEVYQSVLKELTSHENRLVGSADYHASVDRMEQILREAGLEPHRQTFNTLAPETLECRLTVDGVDVTPVYALGPNGAANNTTAGAVIKGPLLWLGNGSLDEMKGKPVKGAIAVLRFDSPNMMQVLSQGALAIVFVGNGHETQWQVRSQFSEMDISLPRLFLHEPVARERGLMDGTASHQAEVTITTVWKDVIGINLWVEIPAVTGSDAKECVVLSATYDTFGTVPESAPAVREAANCALLAEVAAGLRQRPLTRSVFAVFLGSHYAMQDGARMFYFAIRRGANGELDTRAEEYAKAGEAAAERETVLAVDDLFGQPRSTARTDAVRLLEKRLSGMVSDMNVDLQAVRIAQKKLRMREALMPEEETSLAALAADEARLGARRKALNSLRKQLLEETITDKVVFREIADLERHAARREVSDLAGLITHNTTHRELYSRIGSKRITGHYGFDFSNARDAWTLSMNGAGAQMFYHSINAKWSELKIGDFVKHVRTLAEIEAAMGNEGDSAVRLFTAPTLALLDPGLFCVPSIRSVPSRVAHAMQVFGYQMMTVADPLDADEMPYRQTVDLEPLSTRITAFCEQLATAPALSQANPLAKPAPSQVAVMSFRGEGGKRFLNLSRESAEVAGIPENAIAVGSPTGGDKAPYLAGNSYSSFSRILSTGHIFMPLMFENVPMRPLGFDSTGAFDRFPSSGHWNSTRLFYGYGGLLNAPLRPGSFSPVTGTTASGETDSAPKTKYIKATDDLMVFYTDKADPFKMYANGGLLILGGTVENPRGSGVSIVTPPLYSLNVLQQTAYDYLLLNESRLRILREKSIVNDSLESLQADAAEHWEEAVAARADQDIARAVAHEAFAAGMGVRVSTPLRDVTNDMVRAVVLLLLLLLPFAFVMERLMISSTSIYRQVISFTGFFIGTFVLLYMVHPAFAIASSPLVIFLAFIIILLSVVVITIVMSKFKKELRAIQGLSTSAHGVASDSSTAMAAVLIGISGMRNRPLKTFLTALTIILLTFAIVVFASFSPVIGVTESYLGKGDGGNRIELHRFSGLGMPRMLHESLAALYAGHWHTFAREAIFRPPQSPIEGNLLIYRPDSQKWESIQSILAIDPQELAFNEALSKAIPGLADYAGKPAGDGSPASLPPLFLAERTAMSLDLAPGDTVTIGGKAFTFAGAFDAAALDQLDFIDGSKIMPPDFESSEKEIRVDEGAAASELTNDEFVDTSRFTYCSARLAAITIPGVLRELEREQLSVNMNAITMYADEEADVERTATEIAKVFVGPVMAKGARGANQFFFSKSMQASGFAVVIVPLLLGGLIIFNSLLGSIVERRKEIFTYSAMGLAPPDVGALFFAESAVYAILGGMGGYLVSQVAAKIVSICGELGWFVPPEMNFSSLSSVLTIFVVMGMVMVSTIYPAIKAGRSANPGVARKWRMPAPEGDDIEFVFPFTVSADDMGGILAFIGEHFENHGDASIGNFASTEVERFRMEKTGHPGIRAKISLAPFDLGVMQAFTMYSRPSEIEDIDEVVVHMTKVSGALGAWMRGNRVFVDDLREQFLFWRSLPVSTVAHYRGMSIDD